MSPRLLDSLPPPRLPPRLAAVARCVPAEGALADIGTDHALVPVYCVCANGSPRAIATDIRSGPLMAARRSVARWGCGTVELRQGWGLRPLGEERPGTVVLAGMGGHLIRRIVDDQPSLVARVEQLVLQPNTQWPQVREWIQRRRWHLQHEELIEDSGRHYLIVVVRPRPSSGQRWNEADLLLGPILRSQASPTYLRWRAELADKTLRAVRQLERYGNRHDPRYALLRRRHHLLSD